MSIGISLYYSANPDIVVDETADYIQIPRYIIHFDFRPGIHFFTRLLLQYIFRKNETGSPPCRGTSRIPVHSPV